MILNKEVKVNLNPANVKHYESKNYEIPKVLNKKKDKYIAPKGATISVNVNDLTPTANVLIDVACDYCGEIKVKAYKEYMLSINTNEFVKKYCCENCDHHKKQDVYEYKQSHGMLKRGEKGYWNFKENRLKELDNYIKKHGTITNMQGMKDGSNIRDAIVSRGESVEQCALELGYDLENIKKIHRPDDFYNDFENLKLDIIKLIDVLGRFPKQKEVLQNLRIDNNILLRFGGIKEIKDRLGYCDEDDLIDERGFKNLSVYEYMTAQYLIVNDIPYEREVHPFKGEFKNWRSDFTFYLENGQEIHLEIWGYSQSDLHSKRSVEYNKKRPIKENLYNEYGYTLISIDYELFQGKYSEVQNNLYNLFKPYLKLEFKEIDMDLFLPANKLSDDELLNRIMKYSDNADFLPKQKILQENGESGLFTEVLKRYGTYTKFAMKYNKYTYYWIDVWNEEAIFETFDYMIEKYGHLLLNNEIKNLRSEDIRIGRVLDGCRRVFGNYINARLSYYELLIKSNKRISEKDLEYIYNAGNLKKGFNRKYMTDEVLRRFNKILSESKSQPVNV